MNAGAKARILQLQKRLSSTVRVAFTARPRLRSQSGWSGQGQGEVKVETHDDGSLTFTETGHFQLETAPGKIAFRNVFRWRVGNDYVSLSHERRGSDAAVWLFDLVADTTDDSDLISREDHLCVDDRYRARLWLREDGFDLTWAIAGPKKDERLVYQYHSA